MEKVKIKKTAFFVVLSVISFLLCSCTDRAAYTRSIYENQLYGSLESNFKYYYSMDLWSIEQIATEVSSISANSDAQCYQLSGKIDEMLSYSSYYLHLTVSGQNYLSSKLIPDNLNTALGSFFDAKTGYLKTVNSDLQHDRSLINKQDFRQRNSALASALRDLNVDVFNLNEDQMNEYITNVNSATDMMKNITSEQKS